MSKIIIFGTGEVAQLAYFYFQKDSEHEIVAFTVDKQYIDNDSFHDLPLVPFENVNAFYSPLEFKMFVAIGYTKMNTARAAKYYQLKKLGYELVSYVSSRCTFLSEHKPGDNCFILEDNTIQPFVKIGNNVILWSGNHIGHNSIIDDHCFLSSHIAISGNVHVGQYCFIGVNATLSNSINIAPKTLIGAGAILMNDTVEKGVYLPQRSKLAHEKSEEVKL